MMATKINLVKGDINYDLQFSIYDSDGTVVSLAGVSHIYLKIKKYQQASPVTSLEGSILSPSLGTCKFDVAETFKTDYGEYRAEIEIDFTNGKILTAPGITIIVQNDLS